MSENASPLGYHGEMVGTAGTGGMNVPAIPGTTGTAGTLGMAGMDGQTMPRKPQVSVAPGASSVPSARAVPTADVKKIDVAVAGRNVTLAVGVAVSVAVGVGVSVGVRVGVSVGAAVGDGAVGDGEGVRVAVGAGVGSSPQAVTANVDNATTEIRSLAVCLCSMIPSEVSIDQPQPRVIKGANCPAGLAEAD